MSTLGAFTLAVLMTASGIAHFALPAYFRTLVPAWLPAPGALVVATGLANIVAGTLLLAPGSRPAGGWLATALIATYLTSHVNALHQAHPSQLRFLDRPTGVAARLLVNIAYLAWAVLVAQHG
ncbi:DoxX family protein [Streptomyces apocyni]|uniref:DoxX family protein n=1 Tax=Streptomyces apocyni TaxID=2654677 RepID=UPI0012EAB77C|nr:hypothetical protein [Streptomyces apocyni]